MAVLEIERHAAEAGWDQPARLFALVETAELAAREPRLAASLGDGSLTAVEQEGLLPGRPLEEQLAAITWPETVHGCAALVERFVLPPDVEAELPGDPGEAATYAAEHPDRQEVRIVAAATRTGASYCALRLRAHDEDTSVLTGAVLVPELVDLVRATLEEETRMSESLEQQFDDFAPRRTSRARILLFAVLGVIAAIFLVTMFASLYTDRLWYSSVGYSHVFDTMLWTRVGLFAGFGVLMGGAVAANMVIAYRARPFHRPDSPEQTGLDRYRDAVAPIRTLLVVSVAGVIGLFGGVAANGQWRTFLLWANRVPFHTSDHYFHKDVGFYVFTLPWLHFLVGFVIAVLVLSALSAVVVHYLYGGIRLQVTSDRMSPTATIQLSVLVGLILLAKAVGYWLDRFDLVTGPGSVVTGMGYTDQHAVWPARNILVGVALICSVLFFLTIWRRTWLLPGVGISLLVVTSILLGLIWPAFVQHFKVDPSELDKESPYITQNIIATRQAYDLNKIQEVKAPTKVTAATVQDLIDQTQSTPVLDPSRISQAFQQIQQVASYYSVPDVLDVDHYSIQGTDRALVLGVRELDQTGITPSQQNWTNLHTVYTHGNGVIAAFGNQRPPDNVVQSQQIQWAEGQGPDQNSLQQSTGTFENRVYFGEGSPNYSIVGKTPTGKDVELDLTENGTRAQTTYEGGGGVSVGNFFNKLMYAVKFGDSNFLLSQRVGPDSKVLYYRNPVQRVEKVAPWLTVDSDVYPTIVDGRILWIVDGYTTTDRYPQAERDSYHDMTTDSLTQPSGVRTLPSDQVNYVRNAVKATVDAYSGKVTLYAWDETDPMLQAWRGAFPGSVVGKDQIPPDLMQHLRYPEDMFKVQRFQYARYHVQDANQFFSATNQWAVPEDPVRTGSAQTPTRMYSRDPETGQPVWSLLSNYVPRGKSNLVGVVAADSDATSPDYGKILVEEPKTDNVPGPTQAFNNLISDPQISRKTQKFKLSDATTQYGSVTSVPLSSGLMYVVPVYATRSQSDATSYLTLRYVMVQYGNDVGIGDTLVDAITDMAGATPPPDQNPPPKGNQQPTQGDRAKARSLLQKAQDDFAAADKALQQGKAGAWVKLSHQARVEVARALNLLQ